MKLVTKILMSMIIAAAYCVLSYLLWPAAVFLAPVFVAAVYLAIKRAGPFWNEVEGIKTGSVKWLPRQGKTLWLNGEWEVRAGRGGGWKPVKLPSDLAVVDGFEGVRVLEFRRKVKLEDFSETGRVFLGIQGAGGWVTVIVNGKTAARKIYGFLPAEHEITEYLRKGTEAENEILLRVHRLGEKPRAVHEMCYGPQFATGIFRDLCLQERKQVFIKNIFIAPDAETGGSMMTVIVDGRIGHPVAITASVVDAGGKQVLAFNTILSKLDGVAQAVFDIPPGELVHWRADKPVLYTAKARIVSGEISDQMERTVGLREIKGSALSLPERIIAAKRAENFPPYGAAFPGWAMKRDIELAAEVGINTLWSAHFAFHPAFLDQCDTQGMNVVQELPLGDILASTSGEAAASMVESLINDAASHPCFLFWHIAAAEDVGAAKKNEPLLEVLKRAARDGRVAAAKPVADALGIDEQAFEVIESVIDVCREGTILNGLPETAPKRPVLWVNDMLVGCVMGGRNVMERWRAIADEKVLRTVASGRVAGVVLGHLFGWGARPGILSVTRSKKLSADVVRRMLRSGEAGALQAPAAPAFLPMRAAPVMLAAAFLTILYVMPATKSVILYPSAFLSLVPLEMLAAMKAFSFAAAWVSLAYYIETNQHIILSLAPHIKYSEFARLFSKRWLRFVLVGTVSCWLQAAGFTAMFLLGAGRPEPLLGAVAVAGIFELVVAVLVIVAADAPAALFASALLQGIYLVSFISPLHAAIYTCVSYLPLIALFSIMKKKSPIT